MTIRAILSTLCRAAALAAVLLTAPALADSLTQTVPPAAAPGANTDITSLAIPLGNVNRFRNATMDVWQRGTSGTATTTAGPATQTAADGWYVVPTGASATWAQAAGRSLTKSSLQVTGAASVTDVIVKQRIESLVAAPLAGQVVTVQAQVYNNTGGAITPTLTVNRPTAQDNYTSTATDVSAVSLQSTANGAWTRVSYTFTANAASSNGLEVILDFGNNFSTTGKSIQVTELDIRATPGVVTGLNSTPPPPELRPVVIETQFCLWYLQVFSTTVYSDLAPGVVFSSTQADFPVPISPMRAVPTLVSTNGYVLNANGVSNATTALVITNTSNRAIALLATVASGLTIGQSAILRVGSGSGGSLSFSAEL